MIFSCNNTPATDNRGNLLVAGDKVNVYLNTVRPGRECCTGTCINAEGPGGGIRVRFDSVPRGSKWLRSEYDKALSAGREFSEVVPHAALAKIG